MSTDEHRLDGITEEIIGCCFTVSNALGAGFLEKVYENALAHELRKKKRIVEQQKSIAVHYDGIIVGEYVADLVIDHCIVVEIKMVKALEECHKAQCLNYLRATGLRIGLLVNFGQPRIEVKRVINGFLDP
jgi:GxxExxY protein